MTDEEFWEMTYGDLFGIYDEGGMGDEIEADHRSGDQPTHTALLHRTFPTYTESLWLHAYASVKMIVVSAPSVRTQTGDEIPGTVASIPVGWRDMASAETFRAFFERRVDSYLAQGWKRRSCDVREG